MIRIAGGMYHIGSFDGRADEEPVHKVDLSCFEIDEFVLTVGAVYTLCKSNPELCPSAWLARPPSRSDLPATRLTLKEARAIGDVLGKRLPTEYEFEVAFRYTIDEGEHTFPGVTSRPCSLMPIQEAISSGLDTPHGLIGMAGIVWQWTSSLFRWYPGNPRSQMLPAGPWTTVRGGIWSSYDDRPSFRSFRDPDRGYERVGVRYVRNISSDSKV